MTIKLFYVSIKMQRGVFMKLFEQLSAENLSDEENWRVMGKLERVLTIRKAESIVTYSVGMLLFYLYALVAMYALVLPALIKIFPRWKEFANSFAVLAERNIYTLSPLPWYVTVLIVIAGLFVVPWLAAVLCKGITLLMAKNFVLEKDIPLANDTILRAKAIYIRSKRLYHAQHLPYVLDNLNFPHHLAQVLFVLLPIAYQLGVAEHRQKVVEFVTSIAEGTADAVLGWVLIIIAMVAIMVIPMVVFTVCLSGVQVFVFERIFTPLYYGRRWKERCEVLKKSHDAFYQKWIDVDPEERAKYEEMQKRERERREREKRLHDEYWAKAAKDYVKLEKEIEDEWRRYNEWWNSPDPTKWSGSADGI